jgi:hypothetical protein
MGCRLRRPPITVGVIKLSNALTPKIIHELTQQGTSNEASRHVYQILSAHLLANTVHGHAHILDNT